MWLFITLTANSIFLRLPPKLYFAPPVDSQLCPLLSMLRPQLLMQVIKHYYLRIYLDCEFANSEVT